MGGSQAGTFAAAATAPSLIIWPMLELLVAVPFLASMAVLGLPHGAIDHWVYFRSQGKRLNFWRVCQFIISYIGIAAVFYLLWYLLPALSALGFLLLTAYHWGEGDWNSETLRGNNVSWRFGVYRGLLPMAVPVILYPEQYIKVLDAAVVATQSGFFLFSFDWMATASFRSVVLGVVVVAYWLQSREVPGVRRLAVENSLLFFWFLLLPPLLSIGIYFIFWHSLRHIKVAAKIIGRPMVNDKGNLLWLKFFQMAAPFSVPALVVVALIVSFSPAGQSDPLVWVAGYLVVLWSLTWPHAILVNIAIRQFLFASSNRSMGVNNFEQQHLN